MSQYKKADHLETIYVWVRTHSSQGVILIIHSWVLKGKPCFKSSFSYMVVSIKQVTLQRKNSNCWVGSPEYWNQAFFLFVSEIYPETIKPEPDEQQHIANKPKWLVCPQCDPTCDPLKSQVGGHIRSHELLVRSVPSDAQREPLPLSHAGGNAPGQLWGTSGPLAPTATP